MVALDAAPRDGVIYLYDCPVTPKHSSFLASPVVVIPMTTRVPGAVQLAAVMPEVKGGPFDAA
jgi:hypothetical protein